MKTILCLSPTIIKQLRVTYLVNKFFNKNESEPRMTYKMPYNPYLINSLRANYLLLQQVKKSKSYDNKIFTVHIP
jgi:hypothetical protein